MRKAEIWTKEGRKEVEMGKKQAGKHTSDTVNVNNVNNENGNGKQKKKDSVEEENIHSPLVAYGSMIGLLSFCPPFVIFLWGVSRHFHYVPEILAAFFWTLPALFHHFLPYFYVIFLTILLFDRAQRDDQKCRAKYGKYWDMYCKQVPYKIIPGVY